MTYNKAEPGQRKPAPGAEYVAGIGWMAVTPTGRYSNYETEDQALRAALAESERPVIKAPRSDYRDWEYQDLIDSQDGKDSNG